MAGTVDRGTSMDHSHLLEKESDARIKFERACQQIALLDQKIRDLEVRYKRAVKFKKNSFRYNLRLRLSVVTGVKMMYHHYASTKAEELTKIRRQINDANVVPSSSASAVFTPRESSSFRSVGDLQRTTSTSAAEPDHHCD
ncbi:Hypothetical predicted protein [Mytilus galloprovincialis]|uniref:Uncharacterized protein n=1 Tax=Mytilus galloprovincialis TaxID=29158 RepID=A0A8B6CNU2_MYTGA|nr:Hypothetical predicted protein [Mytilus galloprovincialis]